MARAPTEQLVVGGLYRAGLVASAPFIAGLEAVGSTIALMAYDEDLAARVRDLVGGPGVTEKKMFGGLAFLVGGNMAVGVSGQGGLLVRVDPDQSDELVASTGAELMEMRRRSMRGWLRVGASDVASDTELAGWVERGKAYARSLPAK
ncbi:MAG TPA: TfoX/Sxy family protein [Gaiellaceae bacterium]|nr:TfoX/Sxy family protein [Gaiellaceae bacterium]